MFHLLAPWLTEVWGPFRLFGSHLFLIGMGAVTTLWASWYFLPRLWHLLPRDRGRAYTPTAGAAQGKPTGAGILFLVFLIPAVALFMPYSWKRWEIVVCLCLAALTGYLDDRSQKPWGEYRKGVLDLGVAILTSLALCQGKSMTWWLPVMKQSVVVSPVVFVVVGSILLWLTINATNCTDGVDGLAGVLTLLSLFYLAIFLYVIIGYVTVARYLLVPHNPEGASWAVLLFTASGCLAGYLWHNAEPSRVLMGDAGSRFLGLLVGIAVLAAGNPFLILVVAPVVLVNGGTGLVKLALLRTMRRLGFDITPPSAANGKAAGNAAPKPFWFEPQALVNLLHSVRFPLHDHCRKNLKWSNTQVVMRFVLIQAVLTPLLLALLVKVR
jgi:phospho-N-acetylmuramoyl-pentapeptide-transferase